MSDIATSLISDDEREYLILQKRAISGADDGTYEWALNEIDRLREALREIAHLDGANIPNGADFSIAIDIAQSALGEGK